MSFGGDPDFTFPPQPGEWKTCYHKSIGALGICRDCGQRAAIMIHLEKRKPMSEKITFAVEEFEAACDLAIAAIGGGAAGTIFMQRRARFDLIRDREIEEKSPGEKLFTRGADKPPVPAYSAGSDREEEEHVEAIKALNKSLMG